MDNSEDIEEEKKARPENEIKPEVKSFNDEIEQKAAEMQAQHGDKFNAERFKSAAREYAEKNGNLNGISADNFVEKDKENIGNGQGKSYGLEQVNGKFIATAASLKAAVLKKLTTKSAPIWFNTANPRAEKQPSACTPTTKNTKRLFPKTPC